MGLNQKKTPSKMEALQLFASVTVPGKEGKPKSKPKGTFDDKNQRCP